MERVLLICLAQNLLALKLYNTPYLDQVLLLVVLVCVFYRRQKEVIISVFLFTMNETGKYFEYVIKIIVEKRISK